MSPQGTLPREGYIDSFRLERLMQYAANHPESELIIEVKRP